MNFRENILSFDLGSTRMGPGFARPPARGVLAGSGTRCGRVWHKVLQGLVQGVAGSGTRCSRVWYKVFLGLVQGVTRSGTRCDHMAILGTWGTIWGPWEVH